MKARKESSMNFPIRSALQDEGRHARPSAVDSHPKYPLPCLAHKFLLSTQVSGTSRSSHSTIQASANV